MREIKFRAWDNGNSSDDNIPAMAHPQPLEAWIEQRGFYYTNGYQAELNDFNWMDELTFMQFTGLLDKNGVEIYEGDIVRVLRTSIHKDTCEKYEREFILVIEYNERIATFVANPYGSNSPYFFNDGEVIGNIYENPELLQPKHKGE